MKVLRLPTRSSNTFITNQGAAMKYSPLYCPRTKVSLNDSIKPYEICCKPLLKIHAAGTLKSVLQTYRSIIHPALEQAGTGPSWRHIQGSKIAKRLPSVKYSFTVLENRKFLKKKIFEKITYSKKWTEWRAKVSQCRKTERVDPLRFFNIHSVAKHEKIENKNFHFREKISQCRKKN